jgi:hypothetical protein
MTYTIKESSRQRLTALNLPATQFLRSHPLAGYFILAYGLVVMGDPCLCDLASTKIWSLGIA